MSFAATQVLCALALERSLGITNKKEYLSGAVYPDSRYVTKIERSFTHTMFDLSPDTDDFVKGWHTHLCCDRHMGPGYLLGSLYRARDIQPFNDAFIHISAMKLVEDLRSFCRQGVRTALRTLEAPTAIPPRGEIPELLERYYDLLRKLYSAPSLVPGDYEPLFQGILPERVGAQIIAKAYALQRDTALTAAHIAHQRSAFATLTAEYSAR